MINSGVKPATNKRMGNGLNANQRTRSTNENPGFETQNLKWAGDMGFK